ncbi:hypothetical protein ASC97_29130 [Rhizobium sp. Root1203]|uniref:SDR family NAD(P)-dependent oxidoreductase n=1 Tax=Rhizobium sp. Root1203 TaxID=1736427 RepID=UPI00070BCF4B|nr:SDR family NAD(P)-dependent oxidoreductase [Rhizobium sp. Root1203]KQV19736.1 hypothetical protein ASC97_29130 [Rhizobium sp. Root1203]
MKQLISIVTGGSRGVGKFLCKELSNVMPVLNISRGQTPTSDLKTKFPIYELVADLREPADVEIRIGSWLDEHPDYRVVNLVLNAANLSLGTLQHAQLADLEAIFRTNVFSTILITSLISRRCVFSEEGSQVTYLTSSLARAEPALTFAGIGLYSATKAAISRLAMVQAREFALTSPYVRVARVHPGIVDTSMQTELRSSSVVDPSFALKTEGLPPYRSGDWNCIDPSGAMRTISPEMAADFVLWACGHGDHQAREFDYYSTIEYHLERDRRLAALGLPSAAADPVGSRVLA